MLSARTKFALAAAVTFFAGFAALAQSTQELPPGSTTYPIRFPTGSSALGSEDQDTIRAVASKMKNPSNVNATIISKADTVGSADFNNHLSQRRTEAVFEALVYANNVPENRVEMHWTGEHLPFVAIGDEQAELQNRVVVIVLH
jgi:outer membrane protein OmpA-like peptidoglycan-associated protein